MYKSIKNKPGIYSARLAKKNGSFFKAMKFILKKMKMKKIDQQFLFVLLRIKMKKVKMVTVEGKLKGKFQQNS